MLPLKRSMALATSPSTTILVSNGQVLIFAVLNVLFIVCNTVLKLSSFYINICGFLKNSAKLQFAKHQAPVPLAAFGSNRSTVLFGLVFKCDILGNLLFFA
jgi:hypothetical protein